VGALPFNRTVIGCLLITLSGLLLMLPLVRSYLANDFTLPDVGISTHWAVMGLWLVSAAFQTFIFALMIRALGVVLPKRSTACLMPHGEPAPVRGVAAGPQGA
jgi:hypothetical protein